MAIFEITQDSLAPVPTSTFATERIRERQDLQRLLRDNIAVVAPDTYVLAEEYGDWADARRRIDLVCLDRQANIVVVELKRSDDGGHMELQAIRYAGMVSKMTFAQAVEAHAAYLQKIGKEEDARAAILGFLDWDEPRESEFAQETRIVLVSGEFSKEITTAVLWLNEYELDIRCVRLGLYALGDRRLIDIQQVIPLPEANEYQIQIRKKAAEERQAKEGGSDWSRYDLYIGKEVYRNLYKRHLFFRVIQALITQGVAPEQVIKFFPGRKFLAVSGECSAEEFKRKASQLKTSSGAPPDLHRFFAEEGELIVVHGKTYAISNQWSIKSMPNLDMLLAENPKSGIRYEKVAEHAD